MQRKRNEGGGLAQRGQATLHQSWAVGEPRFGGSATKTVPTFDVFRLNRDFHRMLGRFGSPRATTKVPVPFVVVLNNGYAEALALRRLRIAWITMSSSNSRMATTTMSTANSRLPQ